MRNYCSSSVTNPFFLFSIRRRNSEFIVNSMKTKTKTTKTKTFVTLRKKKMMKKKKIDEVILPNPIKKMNVMENLNRIRDMSSFSFSSSSSSSVAEVEEILNYSFKNKILLEEALTHSSYSGSPSYQRLEFIGDAALGLAVANFVFVTNPGLDPGQLSLLRAANISTEKLARVAIRRGLYRYIRHNSPDVDAMVREFALAVHEEGNGSGAPYGGTVKAPKVLADIVESIAAAIYVDCEYDLKLFWKYLGRLLEPLVTQETFKHQPVTMLHELCQKQGKRVDIKHRRNGSQNIASVYVNGKLVGSGCSEQKEIAKITAAKEALKLWNIDSLALDVDVGSATVKYMPEIDGAKQKLYELCSKKQWQNPIFKSEKEEGPPHDRRFICSVTIETEAGAYSKSSHVKPRLKDAENSAASMMLHGLHRRIFKIRRCKTKIEGCRKLSSFNDALWPTKL